MRAIKVWGLAQILNCLPGLFFPKEAFYWVVLYVVVSFIGGLPVLMAFAINDILMVDNNRTAKQIYLNVLLLWPMFTAVGAIFVFSIMSGDSIIDSLPFAILPTTATVISILRFKKLFLVDSVDEASY